MKVIDMMEERNLWLVILSIIDKANFISLDELSEKSGIGRYPLDLRLRHLIESGVLTKKNDCYEPNKKHFFWKKSIGTEELQKSLDQLPGTLEEIVKGREKLLLFIELIAAWFIGIITNVVLNIMSIL